MQIKLKSLHLTNFMAYQDNTITFGDTTKISGKNGSGKSSIANSYMWLMFDNDMSLKSNPKVRREVDGKPVNDIDVSVEAVFDIDGEEVTARKVQKRTFSKDGISYKDDNSYFINEVPKTQKAFNEFFGVDMKILKMCSNIDGFLSQSDKEMRAYLFSKVEDISSLDIAKSDKKFESLVPFLAKASDEETEKLCKAKKNGIEKEIRILQGRINEKEDDISAESCNLSDYTKGLESLIDEIKNFVSSIQENPLNISYENLSGLLKTVYGSSENVFFVKKYQRDKERLEELKKQRINLEQQKCDNEKILYLLSELGKEKNERYTDKVNSLFGTVKWVLHDFSKAGEYKNCCVPTVDGKSILTIESNKANRLIGKLDIVNSLQKIENICCPVFFDDAESLDDENIAKAVKMLDCQSVLLQVNNDDELKVNDMKV